MTNEVTENLIEHGIKPSAQRVAVAQYVLSTLDHPSADQVWQAVQRNFPMISRATVYNTLNLFVNKGLLREYVITEGRVVFDPNVKAHHHFIDDTTGRIHDVPWNKVQVCNVENLKDYEIHDYQVVMRGKMKPSKH
jgi:Fe2+ or Zn2+ uptake regulation protein